MGEIKSAWEIALEKADKLGELSPGERKKQKEEKCSLIGKALAEKYLSQHDVRHLEAEINKCNSEDRDLITQAVLQRLIEGINLRYGFSLDEISQGIIRLVRTEATVDTVEKLEELFREYHEAESEEGQEIERAGREILHQLRISGAAIGHINVSAKEEWRKKLDEVARSFEERLNRLKQDLLEQKVSYS